MPTIKIVPMPGVTVPGPRGERGLQGIQGEVGLTGVTGLQGSNLFSPVTPGDWLVVPTTVTQALNEIAQRLKALEI